MQLTPSNYCLKISFSRFYKIYKMIPLSFQINEQGCTCDYLDLELYRSFYVMLCYVWVAPVITKTGLLLLVYLLNLFMFMCSVSKTEKTGLQVFTVFFSCVSTFCYGVIS